MREQGEEERKKIQRKCRGEGIRNRMKYLTGKIGVEVCKNKDKEKGKYWEELEKEKNE